MAAKAAEFVPRKAVTYGPFFRHAAEPKELNSSLLPHLAKCRPALSEDAPFFTPAGQQVPSAPGSVADCSYGRAMTEASQQTAEGLSEYYQQAMDLVRPLSLRLPSPY